MTWEEAYIFKSNLIQLIARPACSVWKSVFSSIVSRTIQRLPQLGSLSSGVSSCFSGLGSEEGDTVTLTEQTGGGGWRPWGQGGGRGQPSVEIGRNALSRVEVDTVRRQAQREDARRGVASPRIEAIFRPPLIQGPSPRDGTANANTTNNCSKLKPFEINTLSRF